MSSSSSTTATTTTESSSSSSSTTTTTTTKPQQFRTWIKKQQVPLNCSILQLFVTENQSIEINQPLFEYKVYNVQHNGTVGDRTGVFLASIYKNLKNNQLCKARILKVLMGSEIPSFPYNVTTEEQQVVLHIEYVDESVREEKTSENFEPKVPTYTLL